jgi:replicative DNA helicase
MDKKNPYYTHHPSLFTHHFFDEDAERAILGTLIVYPELRRDIISSLSNDDFYIQRHRIIYQAIVDLFYQENMFDIHLLRNQLQKQGKLDEIGGNGYLLQISEEGVPADIPHQIIGILKEKAKFRNIHERLIEMLKEIKEVSNPDEVIEKFLVDFKGMLKDNVKVENFEGIIRNQLKELNEVLKDPNIIKGIPSGFYELDRLTNGFEGGELIIIGARPAMGKTTFALNIAYNVAKVSKKVLFFSLEMTKEQLSLRMNSMTSGVPLHKIKSGMLSEDDVEKITNSYIENADIFRRIDLVDNKPHLHDIVKISYSLDGVDLIIIDYLQLIKAGNKYQMRYQELADIVNNLKFLAKDLNIPVIALAQVNRDVEKKLDKKPALSDLRESGDIEATADVVIFLHREGYYKGNNDDNTADIIVAKNRNGETGMIRLWFDRKIQKFSENINPNIETVKTKTKTKSKEIEL